MKKSNLSLVLMATLMMATVSLSSFPAFGAEALRCYAFFGVQYKTQNFDGQVMTVEDTTKFFFDEATPISQRQTYLAVEKDQWKVYAQLDSKYFRLEFFDKTTGKSDVYSGSSNSLAEGVDTSLFVDVTKDSGLQVSWNDLEHRIGDVILESLRINYATVQCHKTIENSNSTAKFQND